MIFAPRLRRLCFHNERKSKASDGSVRPTKNCSKTKFRLPYRSVAYCREDFAARLRRESRGQAQQEAVGPRRARNIVGLGPECCNFTRCNEVWMLKGLAEYGCGSTAGRLAVAGAVTIGFALLAQVVRGVNRSGMIAGAAACFLLFAGAGPSAFVVLAALFALTWLSTRFGYRRKQDLGVAERGDGRGAWQVLAN